MADFRVEVDDRALRATLDRLLARASDMQPVMEDVARALRNHTEDAFDNERSPFGPAWADLKPATKQRRAKSGHWPGPILQITGQLAGSISSAAGADWASVGVGKAGGGEGYGAIHQFGGLSSMAPGPAAIPARPFLPVDAAGNLPDTLRSEILAILTDALAP